MGLYDSVDRGKPKPKRLTGPIALCCALFLLFGGLTYWACHYQFRFHAFISDLTDSTCDARSTETFCVTVNGSETDVSIDDLSDLLYQLSKENNLFIHLLLVSNKCAEKTLINSTFFC